MREANIFDTDLSYSSIVSAFTEPDSPSFLGTLEFFPEEGKYHYDGHRACSMRMTPEDTRNNRGRCPKCNSKVTVGVMHRVEELADHPAGRRPVQARPFNSMIPLMEIIAEVERMGVHSKKVNTIYLDLLSRIGNEYHVLVESEIKDIRQAGSDLLGEAIKRMRTGKINIYPGYDGEFGTIRVFASEEREQISGQLGLF
jgi:PHP family Zn ribbon phosphoesterase